MKIRFPSREFDAAVAAVCHDLASDDQVRALNDLLRASAAARDEYILRLELHARLASEPDLFASAEANASFLTCPERNSALARISSFETDMKARDRRMVWAVALAACFLLLAAGFWGLRQWPRDDAPATSKAVAMLNRTVNARWDLAEESLRLNAPLEPGVLKLKSGLAEIVFYSGARLIMEGPAKLELVSVNRAFCGGGRFTAEIPRLARGFQLATPQGTLTDSGASLGLNVKDSRVELHVFKGMAKLQASAGAVSQNLREGSGATVESSGKLRLIAADQSVFASLFELQARSVAAEARRFDQWQAASERLNRDPSLLVRFDLEGTNSFHWQLRNACKRRAGTTDATVVGCQWVEGRWPGKRALEFQSVNDRVRVNVPGSFEALTFTAWVRVQGLDRKLNSLFMSDSFVPGTVHWLIRRDGVLGLTVIGADPRNHQIIASPPVITLEKFGMWLHLAVVLDGNSRRAVHYLNGSPISEHDLKIEGPFHIGDAELGNWNSRGFPRDDAFMIRNFSGAVDEFSLFNRALDATEIQALYTEGKPEPAVFAPH